MLAAATRGVPTPDNSRDLNPRLLNRTSQRGNSHPRVRFAGEDKFFTPRIKADTLFGTCNLNYAEDVIFPRSPLRIGRDVLEGLGYLDSSWY